ncbi:glycosyltransferase family 2 protein, partial [Gluconobacter thailandicus]
ELESHQIDFPNRLLIDRRALRMPQFHEIITAHNGILVADKASGELGNTSLTFTEISQDLSKIISITINSAPDLVFLVGQLESTYFRIALSDLSSQAIPLRVKKLSHDECALYHPIQQTCISAIACDPNSGFGRIEGNRREIFGWELFRLENIPSENISLRLQLIGSRLEKIFSQPLTEEIIVSSVLSRYAAGTPEVLDATLPFLATETIESLATRIFNEEALYLSLKDQLPEDIWCQEGIPALRGWLSARQENPSLAPATQYVCPENYTALAYSGQQGDLGSFMHACVHSLRRAVKPSRKTAILACVRNEGIYLLEWIAYHRSIGVEWFFLYSNDNDDSSDRLLAALSEQGIITWIRNDLSRGTPAQQKAYGHALGIMPDILNFAWVTVIDADEFIALDPTLYKSLPDYLKWTETRAVDSISFNWKFMASEPLTDETAYRLPLTERNRSFVRDDVIGAGIHLVKSMFRPAHALQSAAHHPTSSPRYALTMCLSDASSHLWVSPPGGLPAGPGFADRTVFAGIGIYHYFYKSPEEWMWKSSRNRGDNPSQSGIDLRNFVDSWIGNFMSQVEGNWRTDQEEKWLSGRHNDMHRELSYLLSLPNINDAQNAVYETYEHRCQLIRKQIQSENIRDRLSDRTIKFIDFLGIE